MKGSRRGGGGEGSFQKQTIKKVGKNQNKKSTRNLKVDASSFNFIIMIQTIF